MRLLLLGVGLDVLDGFLEARDLLGVLVRDFDPELLLERHHELDRVERVRAQVVDERGIDGDFFLVDPELLHDDALYLVSNPSHSSSYVYIPPLTARTCPVMYAASSDARKQTAAATSP